MVVDSMVNHAWKTAVENGILFHADIAPLLELSIKDADLCVLLGNAFDNALVRILSRKEESGHGFGLYSMESLGMPNRVMVFADEIAIKSLINCFEGKPPLFPFGKDPALSKTLHISL
ncbi:hypothetical protein CLFS41_22340 [Clostridium sp. FS41]|nr:hypothetical protein CLFS41_22340 [Clostridium sp. FS41]